MKIVVLTCVWLRYEVTKVFLEQIKILQEYNPAEFEIELVVVGSKGRSKEQVTPYTKHYIHHENLPLGKKWNAGLKYCEQLDFDFLIILGSDDLLSTSALDLYKRYTDEGFNYIGFKDFYVLDTTTKKMNYWNGYEGKRAGESIGAGRLISRAFLKEVDFKLWNDGKNKGLDGSLTKNIRHLPLKPIIINTKNNQVMLVDLKSKVNLGRFKNYPGQEVTSKKVIPHYFPEVSKMVFRL